MNLQNVPEEQTFWLLGGKPIRNIAELGRELKRMTQETFAFHVNDEKNDFSIWVEESAKDNALATLMRTTKDKQRMAAIVERRIQELTTTQIQNPSFEKKHAVNVEGNTEYHPTIIKTKNVTPLFLAERKKHVKEQHTEQIKESAEIRNLDTVEYEPPLLLVEKPSLETHHHKQTHPEHHKSKTHIAALLISHAVIGLTVGVIITIIILI